MTSGMGCYGCRRTATPHFAVWRAGKGVLGGDYQPQEGVEGGHQTHASLGVVSPDGEASSEEERGWRYLSN